MKKPLLFLICSLTIQSKQDAMYKFLYEFPDQLDHAIKRNYGFMLTQDKKKEIRSVICVGIGGSGCAHELTLSICHQDFRIPFALCKSNQLPSWANENTLVIAASYSGNTTETIAIIDQAEKKGCTIVGVTSGGTIAELLPAHGHTYIYVPTGFAPRAAIGYMAVGILRILQHYGLIANYDKELKNSIELLSLMRTELCKKDRNNSAYAFAQKLQGKFPLIYTDQPFQAIGTRMRAQLAENAKVTASMHVIPELFHNEIESIRKKNDYVIFLISDELSHEEIFRSLEIPIFPLYPLGRTRTEQIFSSLYIIDWISYWLAHLIQVDPIEIPTIEKVKQLRATL